MIIVFGQRYYGRVGGYDDEYIATKFAHVYWLPLVPTGSMWVTRREHDQLYGFETRLSATSVAAAYLRMWAPIVALGVAATVSIAGFVIAAGLLTLSGWSWTWRREVRGREARRAMFNQVAFGTACDPMRRTQLECAGLRAGAEKRFAEVSGGRTPDDVARFGADSPRQAAFAYAVLRVVARTVRGSTAKKALESSERILDGFKDGDAAALGDGPFRAEGALVDPVASGDLESAARAAVSERDQQIEASIEQRRDAAWANSPDNPAVKAEIAANKATKTSTANRIGVALAIVAFVAGAGYAYYEHQREQAAAKRGITVLREFRDDICACPTKPCIQRLFDERGHTLEPAELAALEDDMYGNEVGRLAGEVSRCMAALPE